MAGLWETASKKDSGSNLWGASSGKSVYEEYGGSQEEDERPAFEDLTDEEKKIIAGYNDSVKNKDTFKKSREIWDSILKDDKNKDHELAKKLDAYIIKDDKQVKYTESFGEGVARNIKNIGNFTDESNKAFMGGAIESAANAVNFIGSGFNGDEAAKRTADFMDSAGIRDKETGLSSLESTKVGWDGVKQKTAEEIAAEQDENANGAYSKAGKIAGDSQRIAADIMTTVIPGAAAEKVFRGIGWVSKASQGSALARTGSNVAANVVGGAAGTGAGIIKDPTQLTAENVGTNTAIDVAIGLSGSGLSTLTRTMRAAKNSKQLATALEQVDSAELPKQFADKLNALKGAELSGKNFKKEADAILEEAHNTKKFDVLSDGATASNTNIKTRLTDIDRRMSEVDTPEYQANNGLLNKEAADAKYEEMMSDVQKVPGMPEAAKAVADADAQIKYYNDLRVKNPLARKVDDIKNKLDDIEAKRASDLENLKQMAEDPDSGFAPDAFDDLSAEVNKRYDDFAKAQQGRIDELLQKDPEGAVEVQMLDEAEKTVQTQKMDAQEAIDNVATKQAEIARAEADKIAQTPNEAKIAEHKAFLEQKKAQLETRYEDANKRYTNDNKSLKDVDEELMYMQDGTHPLVADGASKSKQFTRYQELNAERAKFEATELKTSNPEIPKTEGQTAQVLDDALEQVTNTEVGAGAKLGRIWTQPANWLRSAGFTKLADQRSDAILAYNKQAYNIKETVQEWGKTAKGNKSKDLFQAANGDEGAFKRLTPGGRKVVEQWQAARKDLGKQMGLPDDLLEQDYYIPHLFVDVSKQPKLLEIQGRLKKAQEAIDSGTLTGGDLKRKETHLTKLHDQIKEMVGKDNVAKYEDFVKENGNYTNRFLKKREGAEGYQEDFWKATDSYMNAANTKVNLEPTMIAFANAKELTPERGAQKFFQTEIDKMRGTKADVDRNLDDWFNSMTENLPGANLTNNLGTKSLRGFRSAMSLSHIGFSATSAINTLSQVAIMPGSVNLDGSIYGLFKGMTLTGKLAKNTLTRTETAEFKHMARMGVFEGSSHILPEQTMNKYANKFNKAAYSGITGADRFLRMSTYYGAKLKADRMGLDEIASERYIYERVNEVNQNFSKLETPHAFKSQVAKTLGSMVTFVPGMVVRSAEIGAKSIKGAGDIIAHGVKGEPITRAEFMKDIDDISKGVFTLGGIYAAGQVIGNITGQDEVVPNPFNAQTYSSPALQFIFGSEYKTGVMGAFTNQSGDKYSESGDNITRTERQAEFFTELLPSFLIPGYSQGKRTMEGMAASEKGYSETDKGAVRFQTDPQYDAQRAIFGQYSTPEGREYIDNMGKPGGGALTESDSQAVKDAPAGLQDQYYQFFKATDKITGRTDANKEVTKLFQEGRPEAARRKAEEFNSKVDQKLIDFYKKYPDLDDELKDQMKSNVYITLTKRSEKTRSKTDE